MRKISKKRKLELICTVIVLIISAVVFLVGNKKSTIADDAEAEFHFIDVGQGDGAMILTDEVCIVVDCGTVAGEDDFVRYVNKYTDRIDCLVLSHAHEDHMGAASTVIDSFDVKEIVMTGYASDSAFFDRALDSMERSDVTVTEPSPGEAMTVGDVTLEFYSPARDFGDANNNSIVMKLTVDGASVMFTGDAEAVTEADVLSRYVTGLSSHILKVGHHGSYTSTTEDFLRAVDPDFAVISCGKNNDYGHPHRETVALLKKYGTPTYRTDEMGDIVFTVKNGKLELK